MKYGSLVCWLVLCAFCAFGQIDKKQFYKALSSGEQSTIENALSKLESDKNSADNNAYIGALTMKTAGYQKKVGEKLKTFKKGAHLLDDVIKSDPDNAEYRFLRLTIQEHAPGILKYNKEIDQDRDVVVAGFGKLGPELKAVITDYAKGSKVLKSSDLK